MWSFGYLIAVPIYVFGSIVLVSRGKWLPALVTTAIVEAMVYGIFELIL